ncbi:DsbA family protein [Roseitranquillus sediminis]|uniref:DsbA family protein n=1 Tax=Roseitranquillus sediminis TaxID=2809051 RepID=UPI001D0C37A0|nr:DsbA family protein [Roseitranquillus sediminis]MBM9595788.1 thioredoxin domain-containing protein [Roseitranquillus sediminis]
MTRLALAAAFTLTAAPAAADLLDMSAEEREAFRSEVRAYLLDNPEVLMEAIGVLESQQAEAQAEADVALVRDHATALFDDGYSWVGGNPEGDVTMVEFLDYRCGYCRRAYPEVESLVEKDGDVRLIVKEFPILGEQSLLASRFAIATRIALGDEAYEQVHDALMTMRADVTEQSLGRLAEDLELDGEAIEAAMDDPQVAAEIAANHALAESLGISGTPTFVVGDQLLRGYMPLEAMAQVVEQARAD